MEIKETEEFKRVHDLVLSKEQVMLCTGKAGTGKSTLIEYLKEKLEKLNYIVVAPTGIAALNVDGQTIHSFFTFPLKPIEIGDIKTNKNQGIMKKLDLLIIDEISMVRADILDGIDWALQKNRGKYIPFGGVKILMVGDFFQLPPVVNKDIKSMFEGEYKSPYFFDSKVFSEVDVACTELTEVFRQKDKKFIEILDRIRVNRLPVESLCELNSVCTKTDIKEKDSLTLTTRRNDALHINNKQLSLIAEEEYMNEAYAEGTFSTNNDANLPAPYELTIKKGARVMFTRNDPCGKWCNGTIGIVEDIKEDDVGSIQYLRVKIDDVVHIVNEVTWQRKEYKWDKEEKKIKTIVKGEYRQFPLMLAWAVTIHKSQGLTLDNVIVDLSTGSFASGQTYVALSRCRSLEGIKLKRPLYSSDIQLDERLLDFYLESFYKKGEK
jgi:ATP-dependent exoDNAse (exonuclease V) alpha subunit